MRRTIQLAVACAAVLTVAAGQVEGAVLTTAFNADNGQSGNMFDVAVAGNALTVTGLDLNLSAGVWTIEVYQKSGTWVGFSNNAAAWTLVSTHAGVVGAGVNNPTFLDVADFGLAAGTTGLYVTTTVPNAGLMNYTNGTGVGNVAASNADLAILEGAGISYPFGATFTPRIWNGSIYYNVATPTAVVPEPFSVAIWGGLGGVGMVIGAIRRRRQRQAA
jgi:hypothetical protein